MLFFFFFFWRRLSTSVESFFLSIKWRKKKPKKIYCSRNPTVVRSFFSKNTFSGKAHISPYAQKTHVCFVCRDRNSLFFPPVLSMIYLIFPDFDLPKKRTSFPQDGRFSHSFPQTPHLPHAFTLPPLVPERHEEIFVWGKYLVYWRRTPNKFVL